NEQGIRVAVRQILLIEGRRDVELVSRTEIVPIRQRPRRRTAQLYDGRTNLCLQCQQISTVPWREIPTLGLTLIPVQVRDSRGWLRCGWHGRRGREKSPTRKIVRCHVFAVDCGEKPPTGWVTEVPRLHGADAFGVPEKVGVRERAA